MKSVWDAVCVAFTMFSVLPMPRRPWTEETMRYALCAFPFIGAVIGLLWWGWSALCVRLNAPQMLCSAILCLIPVFVTGGIHLDGYADTCDALASGAPPEKKREILKDPCRGAFAVIRLCAYFTAYSAFCAALDRTDRVLLCMGMAFVWERVLSALAIVCFPLAKDTGLAYMFSSAADKRTVRGILTVMCIALALGIAAAGCVTGLSMLCAGLFALWRCSVVSKREFGGMSGDLAGWFLQRAELWMLGAAVFAQLIGGAL